METNYPGLSYIKQKHFLYAYMVEAYILAN